MAWIIIIVLFLLFLFFSDKKQEVDKINNQGGIYQKYKVLIDHFLEYPGVKVESRNSYSMILVLKDKLVITRFTIGHGFSDVSVFWEHSSLMFGKHNLKWRFPETLSQRQMIDLIDNELEIYMHKLVESNF